MTLDTSRRPNAPVRPWVGLLARWLDVGVWSLLAGTLHLLLEPFLPAVPPLLLFLIVLFLYNFVEALSLAIYGTTFGKWLLKVRVRTSAGDRLSFGRALRRALSVWLKGLAAGVPVLIPFALAAAHWRLAENGVTDWDRDGDLQVRHGRIGVLRGVATGLLLAGWVFLTVRGLVI